MTLLCDRFESHRSVQNISQQATHFHFMDLYTLTMGLILLRCTNITSYQFALSIIHSNNVILIVFTAPLLLCNYIMIINTHMESQTYHGLVAFYFNISILCIGPYDK